MVRYGDPKASDPASTTASPQQLFERCKIKASFDFGLRHRMPKRPWRLRRCEVEKSPREAGAGNPLDRYSIGCRERPVSMRRDAGGCATTTIGRDDIDSVATVIEEAVQRCGGSMGENGAWPTGEYGGKQAPLYTEKRMPHRVNPLMDPMESPSCHLLPSNLLSHAKIL